MKSILIIGGLGMLGSQVLNEFCNSNLKLHATFRHEKDKAIFEKKYPEKKKKITFHKFDIAKCSFGELKKLVKNKSAIINCAGIIKPYINEENFKSVETAINVNSIFPHMLNSVIKKKKIRIYQIATDCVFSGKEGNYDESSLHDALDVYGKSKSMGEVQSPNFFNLRCSIIGNEIKNRKSLIEWFNSAKKNSSLNGFYDHLWNGITTNAYANLLKTIIEKKINIPNNINIVPRNKINKYELLKLFKDAFDREDLRIHKIKSKKSVNRTLKSKFMKKNFELWSKSKYKDIPNIKRLIMEIK